MLTPQGCWPTWIDLITFRSVTSMTETSLDMPLAADRFQMLFPPQIADFDVERLRGGGRGAERQQDREGEG
jgi:hypothetical protein